MRAALVRWSQSRAMRPETNPEKTMTTENITPTTAEAATFFAAMTACDSADWDAFDREVFDTARDAVNAAAWMASEWDQVEWADDNGTDDDRETMGSNFVTAVVDEREAREAFGAAVDAAAEAGTPGSEARGAAADRMDREDFAVTWQAFCG